VQLEVPQVLEVLLEEQVGLKDLPRRYSRPTKTVFSKCSNKVRFKDARTSLKGKGF
jgi:hypothetical protein